MAFKWRMTLSIRRVRQLILAALVFVVFSNLTVWVAETWSHLVGFIWGICAAVMAFVCRAKATKLIQVNRQYYLWLAIPGVLAIIPIILRIRRALQAEGTSWWVRVWEMAPILVGFVIPVALLWLAYSGLEGHLAQIPSPAGGASKDGPPPNGPEKEAEK